MPATETIRQKLSQVPHKAGVYLMKDRFGTVIYVGKARDLRKRVSQYFHPSRRLGWDLKFNALIEATHDFDVHVVRSEPEALLLEGKLIKEFHPRYNVSFRDDKRFLLLKVNLHDPIPRFTLTRLRTNDGARYFGPFPHAGALRNTLSLIRRQFNLRGCRPLTPTEADYKHCLYGNLKWCTAPCIGNVTREQYLEQVLAACDFLDGQCEELAEQLEMEMNQASVAQDYEKAAQLRDAVADLKRTTRRTEKFERIPYTLPVVLDPLRDLKELARALGLSAPPARIEGFDISNISGTFVVASMVSFKNGRPDRANYRRFKMKTVVGQDDFASMAETIRRRYSRLLKEQAEARPDAARERISSSSCPAPPASSQDEGTLTAPKSASEALPSSPARLTGAEGAGARSDDLDEEAARPIVEELRALMQKRREAPAEPNTRAVPAPDLILIDGGKGQLSAACAELRKLGLGHLPVIGLAKEFEEIYRPGESEPLRLSQESGALKLLQRIRDESHRVANSYNAQLRIKRISESLLDEFPGIGQTRKAALLKRFGSVQRLRAATLEQIATVPGFGGRAAAELKAFLEARSNVAGPGSDESS